MAIGDLLAQITGEPSPTTPAFAPPKRKANNDLPTPARKISGMGGQAANSSRPLAPQRKPPTIETPRPAQTGGRPSISGPSSAASNNGQPTPPPSSGPPKQPKKGSFAEIMARGKTLHATSSVGKIQHKTIEKPPSKREREATKFKKGKNIQNGLAPNSKFQRMGQPPLRDGKNGVKKVNGKVVQEPEKKIKKAALATTGYSGTARPKPGSQAASRSGPARPAIHDRDRHRKDRPGSRYDSYMGTDEEEDDIGEDDEQDYESDVSSDMEAAVFEVDEEEERAARLARKEDAEALAEENRLKREKEERKQKMAAMAKKAGPVRY